LVSFILSTSPKQSVSLLALEIKPTFGTRASLMPKESEGKQILAVGAVAGALFVVMFTLTQNKWQIDDVLGVWPLHGICGAGGGIAAGIFGLQSFGGLGGVSFGAQVIGTFMGVAWALLGGVVVYGVLKMTLGQKMSQEEEYEGSDLTVHKISATPDREASW
jgi:Amt family ammonium transporter